MQTYHTIDDVFKARRSGVNLSEVLTTMLHSPRVMERIETPFDIIEGFHEGDYLDTSSFFWKSLPISTQISYATAYRNWYAKMFGLVDVERIELIKNDTVMHLMFIPPMRFIMGTQGWYSSDWDVTAEIPHIELIDYAYWLGKYEVTYEQWHVPNFKGSDFFWRSHMAEPVSNVRFSKAKDFCKKLGYLLPNEMEWEMACRAGTTSTWHFGNTEDSLKDYAHCADSSASLAYPVGGKIPNPFGLYDMYGNVAEWCRNNKDFKDYFSKSDLHIVRGGSFMDGVERCRSAYRGVMYPRDGFNSTTGFRVMKRA